MRIYIKYFLQHFLQLFATFCNILRFILITNLIYSFILKVIMVQYECTPCNYITQNKNNHIKHCKTKKHLEKMPPDTNSNNFDSSSPWNSSELLGTPQNSLLESATANQKCEFCGSIFARFSNLTRHYRICVIRNDEIIRLKSVVEQCEKAKKDQEKIFKIKLSQSEKESKHFEEESKYYKQMLKEAGGLVKKSVGSLTYIVENYNDAPAIKMINCDDIKNLDGYDLVGEDILSSYKHKTLSKFLGDIIIILYKKENPKSQSIWNTDTSRLTYLIKESKQQSI